MQYIKILAVLALIGMMMVPVTAQAADNIGSLVNPCFATSWTYRSGGVPSPPGGWVLAGWGATSGGPQYYDGAELSSNKPTNHRCKWEFSGTGSGTNNVIAKEVNWGSYGSATITVYCAARTWGGTTGSMKLGVDANGAGTQWSDCGANTASRTSNDETWSTLTLTIAKPVGATTFTVMLNAVPNNNWNCQFDNLTITGVAGTGTISGTVRDHNSVLLGGVTVSTNTGGYTTTTSSSGAYTLSNVAAGTYNVTASKSGYNSSTQTGKTVTAGATTSVSFTITPTSGTKLSNGDFEGGFTSGVGNGWSTWAGGWTNPISWADETSVVYVGSHSQKWGRSDQIRVHGGLVQARGVTAGHIYRLTSKLRFTSSDSGAWLEMGFDPTGQTSNGEASTVTYTKLESGGQNTWLSYSRDITATGSTLSVFTKFGQYNEGGSGPSWAYADDITLVDISGAITGNVKNTGGTNLSGATVSTNTGGYTATTDVNGNYTMPVVAPGTYNVTASKSGYNTNTQTGKTVSAGATTTVNFTMTAVSGNGTITGYVRDARWEAVSGATVATTSGGYTATTNSSGAYTISNVAVGTYNVVASKTGYQSDTFTGKAVASGTTLTLNYTLPYSYSKFGWHIVIGGRNGYGAFLSQTAGCGKPVAMIKVVDDMSPAAEAKTYSQNTLTVGRFSQYGGYDYNNLDGWVGTYTPQQAADIAYPAMKAVWDQHPEIDIWEIVNEWDSNYTWQADYHIAMMNKADANGYRLGLFSSSCGTPSETVYSDVARACARAKQSGGHVLALHEYGFFSDGLLMHNDPVYLVTRYRMLHNYLVQNNSECPIILTEVGQNCGCDFVGDALFLQDHEWYDNQVRSDSYVLGVAAWTLGDWGNANASNAIDDMGTYICTH